jgi:hypothetical protein
MRRVETAVDEAYRAPVEDEEAIGPRGGAEALFIAPGKVGLMYVATLGVYGIYWFYAHWSHYKRLHGLSIWPVARGIFSIFFANQLFKTVDQQAREAGHHPSWSPGQQAGLYIVLVLMSRVLDRAGDLGSSGLGILGLAAGLGAVAPLISAQRVANLTAGPEAARQARAFSLADGVLLAIGLVIWALILVALLASDASVE